jgi:CHAD domain-containing protein
MASALTHFTRSGEGLPDLHAQLIDSLNERWRVYRRELKRCQKKCSEKAVHDLRVATRRLIATVDILLTIIPNDRLKRVRRSLKKLLNSFGALRDTQIQVLAVEKMLPSYPMLQPFFTVLILRERGLVKRIARLVRRVQTKGAERRIADARKELKRSSRNPAMRIANKQAVIGAVGAAFAKVSTLRQSINPADTATIHALRVSFKKFRYMVEALHPYLSNVTNEQLQAMNAYQMRMGDIQDIEVLIGSVNDYALRRKKISDESLLPVHQELTRRRSELIDAFMKSADEVIGFWREEPAAPVRMLTADSG